MARAARCTHVAMEATGVYWKPVWHILEGRFELMLANAAHVKNVPGRKSDVNDATWIADLLAHGLIRASFVPPPPIQELRDLTRTRKQLTREIVQHAQRIQAVLEEANVKLSSVITDILGASGRRILKAMIAGETDPNSLPRSAERLGCSRASWSRLSPAVSASIIGSCSISICRRSSSWRRRCGLRRAHRGRAFALSRHRRAADGGAGAGSTAAEIVIAEIGLDMSRFPTAGHLLSWAGLVPRLDESAGKRRSTRMTKGAPWLKPVLVQLRGRQRARRTATSKPSSCASKDAAAPRKRLSRSPPRS